MLSKGVAEVQQCKRNAPVVYAERIVLAKALTGGMSRLASASEEEPDLL